MCITHKKWTDCLELTKKVATVRVLFLRKRRREGAATRLKLLYFFDFFLNLKHQKHTKRQSDTWNNLFP